MKKMRGKGCSSMAAYVDWPQKHQSHIIGANTTLCISYHEFRKTKQSGGLLHHSTQHSHGSLSSRRVGQLSPVEEMTVLGDGQRAPGSGGNFGHREVAHAREDIHHARPKLVVLAGVPEPPVPGSHASGRMYQQERFIRRDDSRDTTER